MNKSELNRLLENLSDKLDDIEYDVENTRKVMAKLVDEVNLEEESDEDVGE